jgi:hypothetical protein
MLATNNGQRGILGSHGGATEDSNPLILYAVPLGQKRSRRFESSQFLQLQDQPVQEVRCALFWDIRQRIVVVRKSNMESQNQ